MKKLLLVLSILPLFVLDVNAQKIITNVDKFTGDTTLLTLPDSLNAYVKRDKKGKLQLEVVFLDVSMAQLRKSPSVVNKIYFSFSPTKVITITSDNKIFIRFDDNEVVSYNWPGSNKVFTSDNRVSWPITLFPELIAKLKNKTIAAVRFESSEGNNDFEIHKINKEVIKRNLNALKL